MNQTHFLNTSKSVSTFSFNPRAEVDLWKRQTGYLPKQNLQNGLSTSAAITNPNRTVNFQKEMIFEKQGTRDEKEDSVNLDKSDVDS